MEKRCWIKQTSNPRVFQRQKNRIQKSYWQCRSQINISTQLNSKNKKIVHLNSTGWLRGMSVSWKISSWKPWIEATKLTQTTQLFYIHNHSCNMCIPSFVLHREWIFRWHVVWILSRFRAPNNGVICNFRARSQTNFTFLNLTSTLSLDGMDGCGW